MFLCVDKNCSTMFRQPKKHPLALEASFCGQITHQTIFRFHAKLLNQMEDNILDSIKFNFWPLFPLKNTENLETK
jgi:hypothetical protein